MEQSDVTRIITRLNVGGPARHALLLTRELGNYGFSARLLAGAVAPTEGLLELPGAEVERVPGLKRSLDPIADARALRYLTRRLRGRRPDIVHTHMAKAGAVGRIAARRAGVPVVVHTFHGHVLEGYFSRAVNAAFVRAERHLAARTDALIAVSDVVRDDLLALGIGRPEQWHVIELGLELTPLLEERVASADAKRALGLPEDRPAVGIVGRLTAIKDHATFFRSAARVLKEVPDASFVVAGDGELRTELQATARDLLGNRVHFLGWVLDLPMLYGALDVVALTSRNEGTPVALIEAGAAGLPVVATKVGGVDAVVADGKSGLLVEAGDDESLAQRIVGLLSDEPLARSMGAAGRRRVSAHFGIDRLARDVAALYRQLIAGDRR